MASKGGVGADLRKFMEKRLDSEWGLLFRILFLVKLNGNRHVVGLLRGYDQFMNIVLDNTVSCLIGILLLTRFECCSIHLVS